jgi:hypothetical protein
MPSMHDPHPSPRLDRLLRSEASRQPAGLVNRLFEVSAPLLPRAVESPVVLHRLGFRWLAAAAALLLAAGLSMRLARSAGRETPTDLTLTMVVQGSDASSLGEEIVTISGTGETRYDDLDDEMSLLLADTRIDR